MEVLDAIKNRTSARAYTAEAISEDKVRKLVEAAIWAPSGHRRWAWRLVIVQEEKTIKRIKEVTIEPYIIPTTLMIFCRDKIEEKETADTWVWWREPLKKHYEKTPKSFIKEFVELISIVDIAMAAENVCLAAMEFGIGSCVRTSFEGDKVKEVLDLSRNIEPFLFIGLGYPKLKPRPYPRIPVDEAVISWIK